MINLSNIDPGAASTTWLYSFETALCRGDSAAAALLFLPDGRWHDRRSFTGNIQTMNGTQAIAGAFERALPATRPSNFHLAPGRLAPCLVSRAGVQTIEAQFAFDTLTGRANGILRLVPGSSGVMAAWVLLTSLDEIIGLGEFTGEWASSGP